MQDYALRCPTGAFPTCHHNEIQDLLAALIWEVCFDRAIKQHLHPLTRETFRRQATTTDDESRLDIRARGFWGNQAENTFLMWVSFNLNLPSNRTSTLSSFYCRNERAKWNKYEERSLEVERDSFTPLVFNTSGGASPLTTIFLKHVASLQAEKHDLTYSTVLGWLHARLSFMQAPTCSHHLPPWITLKGGPCAPWEHLIWRAPIRVYAVFTRILYTKPSSSYTLYPFYHLRTSKISFLAMSALMLKK